MICKWYKKNKRIVWKVEKWGRKDIENIWTNISSQEDSDIFSNVSCWFHLSWLHLKFNGHFCSIESWRWRNCLQWGCSGYFVALHMLFGCLGLYFEKIVRRIGISPITESSEEISFIGVRVSSWSKSVLCFGPPVFFVALGFFIFLVLFLLFFHHLVG